MEFKTFEEFKQACLSAGFTESNVAFEPFILDLSENGEYDDEISDHPPMIVWQNFSNRQVFEFRSGLGNETVVLNTNDPSKAAEWGKLIAMIEPNF